MSKLTVNARIISLPDYLEVHTTWNASVDRKNGLTYQLFTRQRKLAERLVRAINSQVVFTKPEVHTDVNGRTYVTNEYRVIGRTMNADLRRLGF